MMNIVNGNIKTKLRAVLLIAALCFACLLPSRQALATCCCADWAACEACALTDVTVRWPETRRIINEFVTYEFVSHRMWIVSVFWEDHVLPAMMLMADQLSAIAMMQAQIVGSFFDAKHQMETQQVLQVVRARAHKDYHPSTGMCEFGTSVKSLAASERKAELNAHVMSQRAIDRHLGNANTSAAHGPSSDLENRLNQFTEKFCDPSDNNSGLKILCDDGNGAPGAADQERVNKDIDYVRTIEHPWTLDIDFTDTTLTHNEEEVLAMASNLYGDLVFQRIEPATEFNPSGSEEETGDELGATRSLYMDSRALLAKRSVAENSFNAITSMKSAGTSGSRDFLEAILKELGVDDSNGPPDDILRMLGMDDSDNKIGPSYHAQMEVLTKKIYQNPDFYTNLYDKPANVERKKVALQAIGLMQKFDLFKSYLRSEANMAVLLEMALIDLQEQVSNELSSQSKEH
jgi:hypothetical protein